MSRSRPVAVVPKFSATWYPPGHRCPDLFAADLLLVHHYHSNAAALIRFGEWLRPATRDFNWTNHGCVGENQTTVIQEVASGAVRSPLSSFDDSLYAVVRVAASMAQVECAVQFAQWTVEYNQGYGFASIVGDGIDDLTGLHVELATYGRMVCSAATCRAAERLGVIPDRDPTAVQPANLAKYFDLKNEDASRALIAPSPIDASDLRKLRTSR